MSEPGSKKILVVDDDQALRTVLQKLLTEAGYEVLCAADGKSGQQIFMTAGVDLVLSDIRMPQGNGIELLHALKKLKPVPVILMTGFSELCETQEAAELGADGFLAKPFKKIELLQMLGKLLGGGGTGAVAADVSDQYCKLNIDDFVTGRSIQFDIYIRLSESRYVKIAHKGEDLPVDRVKAYKSKNLRFLYMRKDEFVKYVGFNVALVRAAKSASTISREKKFNLLKHTGEVILQQVRFAGMDEEGYEYTKTFIENAVSILTEQDDAATLLMALSTHTDFLYAHCVGVSMISVLLAKEMKWVSVPNLFKIAMGGLLHDVGKKEIEASVLKEPRRNRTPGQVSIIETHPVRGLEILTQLRAVPGDVLQIVYQHHENCLGKGQPQGLRRRQIHPLARLIAVADEFCNLVLKVPDSPELAPAEAVKRLHSYSWELLDPDYLVALARLFKVETHSQVKDKRSTNQHSWKSKLTE